jgi:riboflavin synthase
MFTGIVREQGVVARAQRAGGLVRLTIQAPRTAAVVGVGESVCVSGVCLSVVSAQRGLLTFEVIGETQARTTLGRLRPGARVNLEPSLRITDRLSGHIVLGHVDGVGTIVRREERDGELVLRVRVPAALRRWLAPKGPIAVDGVSLTLDHAVAAPTFIVHLIPETLRQTTLGARRAGDRVNVELDYLAKVVGRPGTITRSGSRTETARRSPGTAGRPVRYR